MTLFYQVNWLMKLSLRTIGKRYSRNYPNVSHSTVKVPSDLWNIKPNF